jgi:hypothetical protein
MKVITFIHSFILRICTIYSVPVRLSPLSPQLTLQGETENKLSQLVVSARGDEIRSWPTWQAAWELSELVAYVKRRNLGLAVTQRQYST